MVGGGPCICMPCLIRLSLMSFLSGTTNCGLSFLFKSGIMDNFLAGVDQPQMNQPKQPSWWWTLNCILVLWSIHPYLHSSLSYASNLTLFHLAWPYMVLVLSGLHQGPSCPPKRTVCFFLIIIPYTIYDTRWPIHEPNDLAGSQFLIL